MRPCREWSHFVSGQASIELVDGVEPVLHAVLPEYGDLPVFLTVAGEQIIAEAVLWSVQEVTDINGFNEAVLRTQKFFPLSSVSLDRVAPDADFYHMFGALSSYSILQNVVFEIEVLANNVIQATEAYAEFLSISVEAGQASEGVLREAGITSSGHNASDVLQRIKNRQGKSE